MTLRHIRIFLAVCDNGCNVTRAAESLYMAQPAVSAAIRELEEEYGVRLFDRISRRFYITEAGKRFYQYARRMDSLSGDLEREMHDWGSRGVLRVGCSITVGTRLMPGYVTHFAKIYPEIAVQVLVEQSEGLEKKLLHNELDFAILEGAIHEAGLIGEEYMEDSLQPVAAVGKDFYPWQVLSPQEFQQQPFLLREKGSGTREIFDRVTGEAGFFIQLSWESASNTALIRAAASGLGIAVLSGRLVEEQVQSGKLCPVQLEGLQFRRQFRMVYHQNKYLSQAAREFMAMCRDEGKKKTIF
ncbi:MAG TPA: LysR family transcriptional regulator [Candidatus Gallacutalibacter pullistercoris]|nr:LysR family transcriptional regulator [Candidatus Gallacutalibacter pullistercoris]